MILATHIIIAEAITRHTVPTQPILAFMLALASHYCADWIPHWDYHIGSLANTEDGNKEKRTWDFARHSSRRDFIMIAADALIGSAIALLLLPPHSLQALLVTLLTIVGAILPDFLQGVYLFTKWKFLAPIQKFHDYFHTNIRLGPYPLIGIPLQIVVALIAIFFLI